MFYRYEVRLIFRRTGIAWAVTSRHWTRRGADRAAQRDTSRYPDHPSFRWEVRPV